MDKQIKRLKEIITFSNAEIDDLIIDDTKFGDFLKDLHLQKINNTSTKIKPSINNNLSKSVRKPILKEIIEEDSFLEEKAGKEELFLEKIKSTGLSQKNNNLILELEEDESDLNLNKDKSLMNSNMKFFEFNKETNEKTIEDIFDFINSDENDIQKYLLDKKIINEKIIPENKSEEEESEEMEESLTPVENASYLEEKDENQETEKTQIINNDNKTETKIIEDNDNNNKKDNININNKNEKEFNDLIIINTEEQKENKSTNEIKFDKSNKLYLIEKTENSLFSKEKDKSELKQYLNEKINFVEENDIQNKSKEKKILYEITEFYNKNKLSQEIQNIIITCLFCYEDYIYIGDGGGNLLTYSLKEEKLLKELKNPFPMENNKKLIIKSLYSDEQYIIVGYQRGKLVIYSKNEKYPFKAKLFESFQDISKEDIIAVKLFAKKNNVIIVYCADYKENIFRIKIIKNKILKNTIYEKQITGGLTNSKKLEPYYHLEINPFFYKCIAAVNNTAANIYVVKKFVKNIIYKYNNEDENSFLSFCFSLKKEEKNKCFISNRNSVKICEINKDYTAVGQLNTIFLNENIIQIGNFNEQLFYAYTSKNNIKLIDFNKENNNEKENHNDFLDTISISNNDIDKSDKSNSDFIIDFKNNIFIKNGNMLLYYQNKMHFLKTLSFSESLNKLNNYFFKQMDYNIYDLIFQILIEINKNINPIWQNDDPEKFKELCNNYSKSYLSFLMVGLLTKDAKDEISSLKNKFTKLIRFLVEVNLNEFLLGEKNSLYSVLSDNKLNDFYFLLLEPFIIDDVFLNEMNIKDTFLISLIKCYLKKDNKYITMSKSWLCEVLSHFNIKTILKVDKVIIEKLLINIIIYILLNNNHEILTNTFIDYSIPIIVLKTLLKENLTYIDLNNEDLFVKENRYKDEIIFSNDYLRLKLIWYIIYFIKNKILKDNNNNNNIKENKFINTFIKEVLKIFEEENFVLVVYNEFHNKKQNDKSFILIKEMLSLVQLILENIEVINKYHEINGNDFFQQVRNILEKRDDSKMYLKIFIIQNVLNEKFEIRNEEKLELILFFMEKNYEDSEKYPEIKDKTFEKYLISILDSIDTCTIEDSEKLIKYADKCKDNYDQLSKYISCNFQQS